MKLGTKGMEFTEDDLTNWVHQLCAYLVTRMGSQELARELAQEAAVRLLKVLGEGQAIREPRGWLFQVGRNLAVDEIRRNLPHPVGLEWRSREIDPQSLPDEDVLFSLEGLEVPRGELLRMMPHAMRSLPQGDRDDLQAYYHQGLDFQAIAEERQLSVTTIKGRLFRARNRLREQLAHQARQEKNRW
ncbi:MAG: RNA polymerase sigma factor [Planctomycetota bacterium]